MCLSATGTALAPQGDEALGTRPYSAPQSTAWVSIRLTPGEAPIMEQRSVGGPEMGAVSRAPLVLVASAREHPVALALEQHGYIVLRARSGAVALTKARQASPDAMILDGAALPDMEVLDLARKLHEAATSVPSTPIFIIASSPPTVP